MEEQTSQKEIHDLGARMRADWDRRIQDDYRFWMGDGVQDDAQMWSVGKRDFDILLAGIDPEWAKRSIALELGCGVGRLLRPASEMFQQVIGVDISPEAISKAKNLLADKSNIDLVVGNGRDLALIPSESIDLAFSFASLSSMPIEVIANYLRELSRIVASTGIVRLQLYLGRAQESYQEDTLAVRALDKDGLAEVVTALGLVLESVSELKLPFEVSDAELGIHAQIVSLRKVGSANSTLSNEDLIERLSSQPEVSAAEKWQGSPTEYLMAVSRAKGHLENGKFEDAKRALEYAVKVFQAAEPEVLQILEFLKNRSSNSSQTSRAPATASATPTIEVLNGAHPREELFRNNLQFVRERFPRIAQLLAELPNTPAAEFSLRRGESGAVVLFQGDVALDNVNKPVRASEVWAERALSSPRAKSAERLAVLGFASGYHLEALSRISPKPIDLFEPNLKLLREALSSRPLREAIGAVSSISVGVDEFRTTLEANGGFEQIELLIHPQTQILSRADVDAARNIFWAARGAHDLRPTVAVIGPIYGGTLPIMHYTAGALTDLKQRVSKFDMSTFHKPYLDLYGFVKDEKRVDVLHSHFVEMLSQIVLEGITEKPVDIVICLAQAPLSPRVLTELRARGIITAMWFTEDGKRFQTWQNTARYFDYFFVIQEDGFPALVEQAGAGRAIYLPMACDPAVHRPVALTDEERSQWGSQLSFVGAGYHNRQQMFASLANRDFKIWGTEWPAAHPFDKLVQQGGRRITPEEYNKIFNATAVNLNLHSSMERDGVEPYGDFVNPRTFELAACGAFQLVDSRSLLAPLFDVGTEVVTFHDRRELNDKIDYYLAHPAERAAIAGAARARVLRDHTYQKRLQQMLGYIYADRYEQLRSRQESGPWKQTLKAASEFSGPNGLQGLFDKVYERGDDPTLDALVSDIKFGKGSLTDAEQRLMFLHHVRSQISYIEAKRSGKS